MNCWWIFGHRYRQWRGVGRSSRVAVCAKCGRERWKIDRWDRW